MSRLSTADDDNSTSVYIRAWLDWLNSSKDVWEFLAELTGMKDETSESRSFCCIRGEIWRDTGVAAALIF